MSTVKKAVVLAAGYGTRLRPLTCATPKPLMPVWGETMLARIVSLLRARGVDDIVVNAHYLADQVKAACAELGVAVSYEPEILGNGGVLNPLRAWIGNDYFYLVNADIVVENVPELPLPQGEEIGTCLVADLGPRTIEVEPESGYVTNWKSDDPGIPGTTTYCGFALLSPDILKYVEPTGFSSIVAAYGKAMMDGRFMKVVRSFDLLWEDAGTIERYIELNRDGDDNAFADIPQLKATKAKDFTFLSARGSERVFFGCDQGIAILYDDAHREENAKYAGHARFLKAHGIPVPEVLFEDAKLKTLVFSNAGIEKKMSLAEYVKVVKTLVRFNALGAAASSLDLLPPFSLETWGWERDLFVKHCLSARHQRDLPRAVEAELETVAVKLEAEPKALVHRDFQSTNILWKGDDLSFIDFQGMRLGPAVYDLASLVYDPYVSLTDRERAALARVYAEESGRPEIEEILPFAAVQRLTQCLGAYGRLASVGQPQFTKHVVPALKNLVSAAEAAKLPSVAALARELLEAETK